MTTPAFQPGKFTPVITIAQVPAPGSIALSTDYSGLDSIAQTTSRVALSATVGFGGANGITSTVVDNMSLTVARLLEARNIAEQLKELGVHTKYTSVLTNTHMVNLEPITRAYNYYGGFHVHDKHYAARALEDRLASALIRLCAQADTGQLDNKYCVGFSKTNLECIDPDRYTIGESGEITYRDTEAPLRHRILDLIEAICSSGIDKDLRIALVRSATDIADETSYKRFWHFAKKKGVNDVTDARILDPTTDDHKKHAKTLLGQTVFADGTTIKTSVVMSKINVAYNVCRHFTSLLSLRMRTCVVPHYEGGSQAQLATLEDSALYSEQPISLSDATMAVACPTSVGCAIRFRSAPPDERDNLIRQLVMQSMM